MYILGINPRQTFKAADLSPPVSAVQPLDGTGEQAVALGTRGLDQLGNEYVFLRTAPGNTPDDGKVGFFVPGTWLFTGLTTAQDAISQIMTVCKAPVLMAAGDGGWFQRYGLCPVLATAGGTPGQPVVATATAGQVIQTATITALFPIRGMALLTAGQAPPLLTNAWLQFPMSTPVEATA